MYTMSTLNTDIVVSNFEEHLGQGLGKNAPFALEFGLWLCIVKDKDKDLKWKNGTTLICQDLMLWHS